MFDVEITSNIMFIIGDDRVGTSGLSVREVMEEYAHRFYLLCVSPQKKNRAKFMNFLKVNHVM